MKSKSLNFFNVMTGKNKYTSCYGFSSFDKKVSRFFYYDQHVTTNLLFYIIEFVSHCNISHSQNTKTREWLAHIIDSICITDEKYVNWTLQVASTHAQKAALPFIKSVEVNSHIKSLSACFIIFFISTFVVG